MLLVSVAIDIFHKMALNEHVDIDLFELLLISGIYKKCAMQCMFAAQVDEVDINQYLRSAVRVDTTEPAY